MTVDFLAEFEAALKVRGRARRRVVSEYREHLTDVSTSEDGEDALRHFGNPTELAHAIDGEVLARRVVFATWVTAAAILMTAGSTLALIQWSDPGINAPKLWAVVFFGAAQVAGTVAAISFLHALRVRHQAVELDDLALLARRNRYALAATALTIFSAGAALPGTGSAVVLLAGPVFIVLAGALILRVSLGIRRVAGRSSVVNRSPFDDLGDFLHLHIPTVGPIAVAALAAVAAILRDSGEAGETITQMLIVGGVEACLVLAAYLLLRRPLGIRAPTLFLEL
jgi:hypothetical protein